MSFLAICALLQGIIALCMHTARVAGEGKLTAMPMVVTFLVLLSVCCALIGVITAAVGVQNLNGWSLATWVRARRGRHRAARRARGRASTRPRACPALAPRFSQGTFARPGFALALTALCMTFLHSIERVFGKYYGNKAPAPAVPAKATSVPSAATAPGAVGTFSGTNPQHAAA